MGKIFITCMLMSITGMLTLGESTRTYGSFITLVSFSAAILAFFNMILSAVYDVDLCPIVKREKDDAIRHFDEKILDMLVEKTVTKKIVWKKNLRGDSFSTYIMDKDDVYLFNLSVIKKEHKKVIKLTIGSDGFIDKLPITAGYIDISESDDTWHQACVLERYIKQSVRPKSEPERLPHN